MPIWENSPVPRVSFDAAGLVSPADLSIVQKRTVLTETASWLDIFIICPGLHRQQAAPDLNSGKYPAIGALTSGYVFRIENPATSPDGTAKRWVGITAGEWLGDQSFQESYLSAIATVLVYLDAALASNVKHSGKLVLSVLLVCSAGLLAIANESPNSILMHGCKIEVKNERRTYRRRLELAEDLLKEPSHNDQARRAIFSQIGITMPSSVTSSATTSNVGKVTM